MAKFLVLIAAFIALLALADASSRYTVITTVEEVNQGGQGRGGRQQPSERCRQQIQERSMQLDTCAGLLYEQQKQQPQQQQIQQLKGQCCETLRDINDQECRCEAISEMVGWMLSGPSAEKWISKEKQTKLRQSGSNLPRTCNLQHECQIQSLVF